MAEIMSSIAKRRAEELGEDVWEHFVVPLFFNKLDFYNSTMSKVITAGRGYGKTMLLRYLTHTTSLSQKRMSIPADITRHIGLYWRTDMQFCSGMTGRGIDEEVWNDAFEHFLALTVGSELLRSLESLAISAWPNFSESDLSNLDLNALGDYGASLGTTYETLRKSLEQKSREFELWVRNVRKAPEPIFLPGTSFLQTLIQTVRKSHVALRNADFFVYIDEYENLLESQQWIVNTWIKFSKRPLIINLAMKRNAMVTRQTVGTEYISGEHDFTPIDLDREIYDEKDHASFELFAGEIVVSELQRKRLLEQAVIDFDVLRDPTKLHIRLTEDHRLTVKAAVHQIFPTLSHREVAALTLKDRPLRAKLVERVQRALKVRQSGLSAELFVRDDAPQESVVCSALLWRKDLQPDMILAELQKAATGEATSKFDSPTSWRTNNFVASLLQLYRPYDKACPIYAGFSVFTELAKGNLRHFLGLCNHAMVMHRADEPSILNEPIPLKIGIRMQTNAAKHVSNIFLGEINSFGAYGPRLHSFVHRLGNLFIVAHSSATLGENEQNHFAVTSGSVPLTLEDMEFIREAEKYSVLLVSTSTKEKNDTSSEQHEYQLNPIYAPYFNITYRKKRRLELSADEFIAISRGGESNFQNVLTRFRSKFKTDDEIGDLPLFTDEGS